MNILFVTRNGKSLPLLQEAVFYFGKRLRQGSMTFATFGETGEYAVFMIVELFLELVGIFG